MLAASGQGKLLREWAGVSIGEVATATGAPGLSVHRWETGQEMPSGAAGADWARVVTRLGRRHSRSNWR